jgi:hypothetical protein
MTHRTDDELDERTVDLVRSALEAPWRGEGYGRQVWDRLQPKLGRSRGDRQVFGFSSGGARFAPWALAAAILVVVAGAFFAGRATQRPREAPLLAESRRRVLDAALDDHLERSRMILLEFVNAGPLQAAGSRDRDRDRDRDRARARAEELVASNRLYRQAAVREGEAGVADLLDQLERVLLEIANSPTPASPEFHEALRRRIEEEGVLFKIEIVGARAGQRADRPAGRPVGVRS